MPKILAIDDINDNLVTLKAIIDDAFPGSVVFKALNGPEGIELAIANNPDVILLDIIMPGMDGFEVCRLLKLEERTRDIPVVFLTALKGDKENRIKALEVGAEGFLSKPIDEIELIAQIRAMVKIKAASEQRRNEKEQLEKLVKERTSELLQSQAQLKSIFENLQDAYFQADLSGKFTLVSPSALKMYGYRSIDELVGRPAEQLYFNPKERDSLISILRTEGQIKDYVSQGRKSDGSAFWVSMNIQWLWSKDRQIIGTEGVVRDITERVEAEKTLKESEEKYRLMVDLLPEGVIIHEGGKIVFANATALKTVGATSFDELIERPLKDYVHPDFREVSLNRIMEIYSTGQPSAFAEEKFITLNNEIIDVEVIGIPVKYMGKPAIQAIIRNITERKKAERAIKESEARLKDAQQIAKIGSFHYDALNDQSWWSDELFRLYGLEPTNRPFSRAEANAFSHTENKNTGDEMIQRAKETNAAVESEYKIIRADGSVRYHSSVSRISMDNLGQVISIDGTIQDISDRKLAEQALQKSEAQFREFFEKAADAIFIAEIESGIIVDANEAASRLMLRSHDELIGIHQIELHPPIKKNYTKDTFKKHKDQVKNKVTTYAIENSVIRADGTEVQVEILASEVDYHGKRCIIGTFRDITQRKKAEDLLRESEMKSRSTFEQSPVGSVIVGLDKRFIKCNAAFCRFLGYTEGELIGKPISEITYPDDKELGMLDLKLMVEGKKESSTLQKRYLRKDGTIVWGEVSISLVSDEDNKPMYFLPVIQDITERKITEEALKNSLSLTEATLESIHNGILVVNSDGKVVKTSSRFAEMWKIPEAIMASGDDKTLLNSILDQLTDPDESVSRVMQLYANPEAESTDLVYFKDGRIFERISKPMHLDGKPQGRVWSFLDITDRKRADDKLRENVARLELAMSTAKMSWWEMDIPTGLVKFEKRKAEMLGYDPEKFNHYTNFTALVHPDDYERTMNAMRSHLDGSLDKYEVEYRIKTISGEYKWFYDIGSVTKRDSQGRPLIISGLVLNITERKEAEELFRENEYFFKESQHAAFIGSYKFNLMNDSWTSSEVLEQIFGIDKSYTRSLTGWLEIAHPDDREMMARYFSEEVVSKRKPFNKEYRIIRKSDGETRWVLGLGKLNFDAEDNVTEMVGTIQDITERKQAEELLRETNEFSKSLLKTIPFGMNIVDEQGNILFQNQNFENVFGNNVIGAKCWELYRDEKSQCPECPLRKGIEVGKTDAYESSGVLGGRVFAINHTGMMFKGKKAMLEIFQDITERKKSEQELQEREQLFRGLFNASPDAIVLIDPHHPTISWPIVDCNEASCRMNGYTREEMIGQSIDLLNGSIGTREDRISYYDILRRDGIIHAEIAHRHKDGHVFPIETSSSIINIGGHKLVLGIDRDITGRKQAEFELIQAKEKAQESDRLKSAFLANMSHEIRTPLNSIIGFSELMADPDFEAGQQTEFAKIIINSGNSLLSIISDIMDFSKIEAGQVIVRKSPFILQKLIFSLQNEYSFAARGKDIELRIDPLNPKDDIWIRSDENRLKQVLVNLVGNAIKFTKEGYVEIGIKAIGDCIQFQISDTGIGIPKEYHDEIFERFRQVESSNSRKYGGNGLGLAISKSLIEMMGGKIWIESVQGKGSTFYFTIPIG